MVTTGGGTPLVLERVSFVRDGREIISEVSWRIERGTTWAVLGRNGSGKTSLIRIAALYEHPSSGSVEVEGQRLGQCDVRSLRRRIGFSSAAFADLLRGDLTPVDIVMCAQHASLEPWWHTYGDDDRGRARRLLDARGVGPAADRPFSTLSSGERQRVLLARAQMTDPGLILLDEPNAGLDLGGREELVSELERLARGAGAPIALVTHHVEEIPPSFTHALLIRDGATLVAGPIDEALSSESLSECFEMPLRLERRAGRFTAWR